ncbi:Uncharacterised protein [Mycobacteroides abscessus subsp. abscessus]|nr:Uncharacterised protein [Mycobacteroides abscessus subsp. abscessus]
MTDPVSSDMATSPPGSGVMYSRYPRSASGSPTVAISQSSTAVIRAVAGSTSTLSSL